MRGTFSSTRWAATAAVLVLMGGLGAFGQPASQPIDWGRAQQIFDRNKKGEKLTSEEQAYLQRAMQLRRQKAGQGGAGVRTGKAGGTAAGTAAGKASQLPVPTPTKETGLIPLCDMDGGSYKGEDGGLYGKGSNQPPDSQMAAARAALKEIQPLDAEGRPAPGGKIVLLSLGMSNTTMEFSKFKEMADKDPDKSPKLVIVDGAQGGQDAAIWADPNGVNHKTGQSVWGIAEERMKKEGVTPNQVQAVWLKQALISPAKFGEFPKHAQVLRDGLVKNLQNAKQKYPNLSIAYLSSRIYAGYAKTALNPEPYSYEGSFSVRWLIQAQIKGDPNLNADPAKGAVKAPVLLWGPYLWTDGMKPRKSDGLIWREQDVRETDGTHPSASGCEKVANLLLTFLKTDPTARPWFVGKE